MGAIHLGGGSSQDQGKVMNRKLAALLLFVAVVLALQGGPTPAASTQIDQGMIWTQWDADHYALIDDGEAIWVGSGSGLIRWDKESGTTTRISTAEGLPHRRVFSTALDGEGNRWFGGDAGLSKLAKNGEWTHYNRSNSGIFRDGVESIAVSATGHVWLGHLGSPYVSHLRANGSWETYPNRQTAVTLAYEHIKQTLNQNDLWAVADDEVWVGYDVFDGASWQNRVPTEANGRPLVTAAGSGHKVWVLQEDAVFFWDGDEWGDYPYWFSFAGELNTLTVDKEDGVWVGGINVYSPYSGSTPGFARLPEKPDGFELEEYLNAPPPIAALLAANEGLWGIGPNWLLKADGEVIRFADAPSYTGVSEAVVDRQGRTWIESGNYEHNALQIVDDMGTATMGDDRWTVKGKQPIITALEPTPNGDLWVGYEIFYRFLYSGPPTRYHGQQEIEYYPPTIDGFVDDIFDQDGQHIWFAYSDHGYMGETKEKGVWSLDDGGTAADPTDDVWTAYAIDTTGHGGRVAVVDGRIWYGNSSGLYAYRGSSWEQVSSAHVKGLVPGAAGELYVDLDGAVLIVEKDGSQWRSSIPDFSSSNLARVKLTERRNRMWTVAPDGAVWYWQSRYDHELARRSTQGVDVYETPTTADFVEVDENNHVWLADGALWRLSPEPDFSIEIGPATWFMAPNSSRSSLIQVKSSEGYQETVTLAVSDLPDGVTAQIVPETVIAGEMAVLTLTTEDAALADGAVTITGVSGSLTRQQSFKLAIVDEVHDMLLPFVTR